MTSSIIMNTHQFYSTLEEVSNLQNPVKFVKSSSCDEDCPCRYIFDLLMKVKTVDNSKFAVICDLITKNERIFLYNIPPKQHEIFDTLILENALDKIAIMLKHLNNKYVFTALDNSICWLISEGYGNQAIKAINEFIDHKKYPNIIARYYNLIETT